VLRMFEKDGRLSRIKWILDILGISADNIPLESGKHLYQATIHKGNIPAVYAPVSTDQLSTIRDQLVSEGDAWAANSMPDFKSGKYGHRKRISGIELHAWLVKQFGEERADSLMKKAGVDVRDRDVDELNWLDWYEPVPEAQLKKIRDYIVKNEDVDRLDPGPNVGSSITGKDLYGFLTGQLHSKREASLLLLRAGIDGIIYPAESLSGGVKRRVRQILTIEGVKDQRAADWINSYRQGYLPVSGRTFREEITDYVKALIATTENAIRTNQDDPAYVQRQEHKLDILRRAKAAIDSLVGKDMEFVVKEIKVDLDNNYVVFDENAVTIENSVTLDSLGLQSIYEYLSKKINEWKDTRTFHKQQELDARTYGVDSDQKITTNEQESISPAWQWLMSPKGMFVFKNIPEQAKQTIRDIYNAKKRWLYETINENNDIDKLERQLTEEERKQVTVLGNKIQDISHRARTALAKQGLTSDQIDTILQPKIEEFIDNYQASDRVKDMYRTVRDEFFDKFQALYKKHLFRDLRYHTKENFKKAIDDIFVRGVPWEVALDSNDIKKSEDIRRFKAALQSYTEQLGEISKWGLSDYWTHFMRGNIVVRDGNKIITVALRTKDAIDRAKEYLADHPEVKEIKIDNSFLYTDLPQLIGRKQYQILRGRFNKVIKEEIEDMTTALADEKVRRLLKRVVSVNPAEVFAGPTLDTKWVLPGEENIFDAMRAYSRVMWKKMTFDPVIWDMRANLDKYTGNVQDFLQKTLDDAKGRYWMGDKVLDYFMEKLGVESSNTYSGIVGKVRKGTVWMKLGYRPVAAVVNGIDGFSRIFLENDAKVTIKALRYLNSPEGQALMDRYSWQLGTQAIEEEGHVTAKMKLYSPLGIFNAPELPVRRWNWMTAYMAYKEDKLKNIPNYPTDKLEEEAINFAADSVDRLQGANILCSVPAIMRSPTGRLLTVFKPFLSRTIEMMVYNRNNFSFWAKFIPYIGLVGGPRAIIAMAKSFPFIAAIAAALGIDSLWDRLDEYVLRKIPSWAGGLASQFGMDIVGPATVQLPTSWMDLVGGAAFSTMYNTANVIGEAMGANNWWGITKQGVKKEIPAINNLWSVYDSVVDKNGWVRDEKGEPQYNLYTGWDKGIMLFGAKPQARSYVEVINRIAMQQKAKEIEKSKDIYAYLKRRIANENTVTPDMLQQVKDDIVKYHITMQSFDEALANIHIPKGMRAILKSDVVDRPDLWEKVKEADKAYASKILFPKK
jgi:hypothetical protein